MQYEILQRPANTVAKMIFNDSDQLSAEGGSMIAMSAGLDLETTTYKKGKGGLGKALKRMIGGESMFVNHYQSTQNGATLYLAPALSGDIIAHQMQSADLIVQGGAYMAHWGDIELDMSWQGFKNLLSKEGLFWLRIKGTGNVLFNSFGTVYEVDIEEGREYIVDSGHIVAFEEGLDFKLSKVGTSWISSFLGGEGIVCRFSGKGKLWCQSHNARSFGMILGPKLRPA